MSLNQCRFCFKDFYCSKCDLFFCQRCEDAYTCTQRHAESIEQTTYKDVTNLDEYPNIQSGTHKMPISVVGGINPSGEEMDDLSVLLDGQSLYESGTSDNESYSDSEEDPRGGVDVCPIKGVAEETVSSLPVSGTGTSDIAGAVSIQRQASLKRLKNYRLPKCGIKGHTLIFFNEFNKRERDLSPLRSGNQPERLKKIFEDIGYNAMVYKNKNGEQMRKKIRRYATRQHCSSFICFISSHGENGEIYDGDGNKVKVDTLVAAASGEREIPKCFVICACRSGVKKCNYKAEPMISETIIAYASLSGTKSYHYEAGGSVFFEYFIQNLAESLELPACSGDTTRDVEHLLKKVFMNMKVYEGDQVPVIGSNLSKNFFLRKD